MNSCGETLRRIASIQFAVEDERALVILVFRPEASASEEQPEFERHIESRKIRGGIKRDGGEVVYAEPALLDYSLDFR